MKVLLTDTMCRLEEKVININTLDEIVELAEKYDSMLVIKTGNMVDDGADIEIEIYNGYRE